MRLITVTLLALIFAAPMALGAKRRPAKPKAAAAGAEQPAPPPPPRGRMEREGAQHVSGPITDIEPTLRKQANAKVEACYERQYQKDPRLQGVFIVELIIDRHGRIKDLEPVKDSAKSEVLSGCIMTVMRRLQFPRSKTKGDTVVKVPITFVPAPPPPPPPPPLPAPLARPGVPPQAATSPTSGSASEPVLRR